MKKLFAMVLVLVMLVCSVGLAEMDWSALSTEELIAQINLAKAELAKREQTESKDTVLVDAEGITLSLTGEIQLEKSYDDTLKLVLGALAVNSSDKELGISVDEVYVNGWNVTSVSIVTLAAGKKEKTGVELYEVNTSADLNSLDELETIEFHCYVFDADSYETLADDIVVTVSYN